MEASDTCTTCIAVAIYGVDVIFCEFIFTHTHTQLVWTSEASTIDRANW